MLTTFSNKIQVADFPAGIYVAKIYVAEGIAVKKFIKS